MKKNSKAAANRLPLCCRKEGECLKVLVDADACPVREIIVRLCREKHIPLVMVTDTSHRIDDGYSQVITVDKGRDSADLRLINEVEKGDIVVTQDYGVAALALGTILFSRIEKTFMDTV